jgi:hypothetical protein
MTWKLTPNIAAGFFDGDGTVDIVYALRYKTQKGGN